ncbi:MAG: bifunctional 2-polyprenyl-6-hydroxyphenol methylase/3-demethylubiquinol 3-O-methyltransferase UbiG [Rickettsiales bacterium]|jgi:2-polyprenyl-6-hydroxyphenyl methylase/3-demethylubiquinone-9 3-methyltransferase|nr:bifunctional 2-polyprenyl-6-hydroxyphenol methylase/3-demethylubiquinol 3-O-methyltransferase UbiG [Rickettsiales bacterium]
MTISTSSAREIVKFESMAEEWWNPHGKFKPLHDLTPLRLEYITSLAKQHFKKDSLKGIKTLDIGCGGGLISEPLSRLGTKITGIDASSVNINIARSHANKCNLNINYQQILAEDLAKTKQKFQLILALEIIEHVENIELFIKSCATLLEEGGIIIFSTINRTSKSFLESIVAAEYILRWLPIGTHSWSKFVKPSEINKYAIRFGLKEPNIQGLSFSLTSSSWNLSDDIRNNYFISYTS